MSSIEASNNTTYIVISHSQYNVTINAISSVFEYYFVRFIGALVNFVGSLNQYLALTDGDIELNLV